MVYMNIYLLVGWVLVKKLPRGQQAKKSCCWCCFKPVTGRMTLIAYLHIYYYDIPVIKLDYVVTEYHQLRFDYFCRTYLPSLLNKQCLHVKGGSTET